MRHERTDCGTPVAVGDINWRSSLQIGCQFAATNFEDVDELVLSTCDGEDAAVRLDKLDV